MAAAAVLPPSLHLPVGGSVYIHIYLFIYFSLRHLCVTLRKLKIGVLQARVFGLRGSLIKYKRIKFFFSCKKKCGKVQFWINLQMMGGVEGGVVRLMLGGGAYLSVPDLHCHAKCRDSGRTAIVIMFD